MNNQAPPFDNVQVRRAMNMAINRQELADLFTNGDMTLMGVLSPNFLYGLSIDKMPSEAQEVLEFNPQKARQLLAEAGYPNGLDTSLTFSPYWAHPAVAIAETMVGMWEDVGARVKLNLVERTRWLEVVIRGNILEGEMGMSPGGGNTFESSSGFNSLWSGGGTRNRSEVSDPEYDKLYEAFSISTDDSERRRLAGEMQVITLSKAYRIFSWAANVHSVAQEGLQYNNCCQGGGGDEREQYENMWWK